MTLFRLVSIENFKLWKRLSVRVMLILTIALALLYCVGVKYIDSRISSSSQPESAWRQQTEQTAQQAQQTIDAIHAAQKKSPQSLSTRFTAVHLGSAEKELAEAKYRLAHNLPPERKPDSVWGWMTMMVDNDQVPGIGNFIALFGIIFVSAIVAGEFTEGTMKAAISRPFSRAQILTAKAVSSLLFALVLLGVVFGVTFIGCGLLFGFQNMGEHALLWTGSQILSVPAGLRLLALYGMEFLTILFFMAFGLLLAVLSRSRSIATGISLFLLFIGGQLFYLLGALFDWGKFTAFPLARFEQFVVSGSPLPGTSLGFALAVCGVFAAAFVTGSYLVFRRRDI